MNNQKHSGYEVEPPIAIKPLPADTEIIYNADGTISLVMPKEE